MAIDVLQRVRALPGAQAVLAALTGRRDVWIVGGAVRDALLDRPARDLDLVVEGDAAALADALGTVLEVHDRFATCTVDVDGALVNVASARTESYPEPGALPEVRPGTLAADQARRDFTVNALGADLTGGLHAPPGTLEDLDERRLRVLHDRSFADDPTRLWRLARYSARLGFAVEPHTEQLARAAVAEGALQTVSGPRLGAELSLALNEPDPAAALAAAHELGLLPAGMAPRRGLTRDALALLPEDGHPGVLALAAMSGTVAPERLRGWLDALGIAARDRDQVVAAASGAEPLAALLSQAATPSQIAAAARRRSPEHVALAGALGPAGAARAWLTELRDVRLEISGDDLLAEGIPPGPEMGRRLDRALAARLDGRAVGAAAELAAALEHGEPE